MTICSADIHCPASPRTRKLFRSLVRLGVLNADGCVAVSKPGMGEPPTGHDRVVSRVRAGFPPLGGGEHLSIQSTMADEMVAIVEQMMPAECGQASVLVAQFSLTPFVGVASLSIQTYGLIDRVFRLSLN